MPMFVRIGCNELAFEVSVKGGDVSPRTEAMDKQTPKTRVFQRAGNVKAKKKPALLFVVQNTKSLQPVWS